MAGLCTRHLEFLVSHCYGESILELIDKTVSASPSVQDRQYTERHGWASGFHWAVKGQTLKLVEALLVTLDVLTWKPIIFFFHWRARNMTNKNLLNLLDMDAFGNVRDT